ncbi:uncharacterized protein LOC127250998 [Andrographis paniculata]|uniref:uncharacterized protein LOC127250998 n=1 Tax=Andrographis paniculata TaxID=175694 RepID=UPI0021E7BA26|nr:uncharacterized protein LOC127250998 [Andrographis paniculata]
MSKICLKKKIVFDMEETLLTTLAIDNHHHPSTLLSMDSSASSSHEDLDLEMNRNVVLPRPPDINLPLSVEQSPPPPPPPSSWNPDNSNILDVGIGAHIYENENCITVPKILRKCTKRVDSIWGAWFFFTFYFKPVLNEKSKAKIRRDRNGITGFDKSDLQLNVFMVQHDLENLYMWVFKERPENALGKMQLRSYMNGHSRQGVHPFPFSVDRGFVRSHRMQRKYYRGLSNPQCVHGIEFVPSPSLMNLDDDDRRKWAELTGRELDFTIPPEASAYSSWRNLPNTEFEVEKTSPVKASASLFPRSTKFPVASVLNFGGSDAADLSPPRGNKRKKEFLLQDNDDDVESSQFSWLNGFTGVLRDVYGPVTAAKTIYEDEHGYLIMVSLPFVDLGRVKVSWRNTLTHGIVKVCCTSTSRATYVTRNGRTFKLMGGSSEHCPPGEFVREIALASRIPEDANIEAYYDGVGTVLEIMVPKIQQGAEEHEVRVCLRPRQVCRGNE